MGKITVTKCEIEGLCVIEPTVFKDERGFFMETYNQNDFKEAGLDMVFVQDNQSMSTKGVLRGLHFQKEFPQGKLVRVVRGAVFDVAVDLRASSKTFGKWFGVELSAENKKQFYIPDEILPCRRKNAGDKSLPLWQVPQRILPGKRSAAHPPGTTGYYTPAKCPAKQDFHSDPLRCGFSAPGFSYILSVQPHNLA